MDHPCTKFSAFVQASRASRGKTFGESDKGNLRGAREEEKSLTSHISPVRGAGALIFLVANRPLWGTCLGTISAP